jgi:hypothetical protein
MPLVKSTLQTKINTIMKDAFDAGLKEFMDQMADGSVPGAIAGARSAAATKFASKVAPDLATAIDDYIKSATVKAVTIPPGQAVATAGSPAAQVGATTAPVQSLPLPSGLE